MKYKVTAPTWAEINLDNIKYNLNNIKKMLKEDAKVCGVVKADAYGHGSVQVSKFLEKENIDYLAVARFEEALELRQNDINVPILCLGYFDKECAKVAIDNNIYLTVYSYDVAEYLNDVAKQNNKIANIHIKLDTGMSRIGFATNKESIESITQISKLSNINIEGIYTHFAKADEEDKTFTYSQMNTFNFVINELEKININIPIKHVSNSAATMDLKDLNFNMVRCGIILYGHYPSEEVNKSNISLKPAMTLKTRIAHIKEIDKGAGVSYGLKYIAEDTVKIATLPIGYADGFTRLQNNATVMIKENVFNVVGRICMDQCMVEIDKNIDIKVGEEVIIFGDSNTVNVESIAKQLGTINYEILCMVSRRVDRIYMEKNEILQCTSYLVK